MDVQGVGGGEVVCPLTGVCEVVVVVVGHGGVLTYVCVEPRKQVEDVMGGLGVKNRAASKGVSGSRFSRG